jgi:hypothetical protein
MVIADQVLHFHMDRHDPERWHIEKSEIVAALRRLDREQSPQAKQKYSHTFTPMTRPDVK